MANTISTRSAIFVQFNVDLNAAGGVALRLVCNRDYAVVDYNVLVVAVGVGGTGVTATPHPHNPNATTTYMLANHHLIAIPPWSSATYRADPHRW